MPDPPSRSPCPLSRSPPRPPVSTRPLTDLPARSKAPGPTPLPREGDGGQGQDARLMSRERTGEGQSPGLHRHPVAPLTGPSRSGGEGNQGAGPEKSPDHKHPSGQPANRTWPTLSLTVSGFNPLQPSCPPEATFRAQPLASGRPSTGRTQAPAASREERGQLGKGLRQDLWPLPVPHRKRSLLGQRQRKARRSRGSREILSKEAPGSDARVARAQTGCPDC